MKKRKSRIKNRKSAQRAGARPSGPPAAKRRPSSGAAAAASRAAAYESRPSRSPLRGASASKTRDPFLGRTLGGYEILERTATGPTYVSFKADQPAMGRRVTLEILADETAQDNDFLLNFYRTARFAAQVQHPNILGIYDVNSAEGVHFCAREYVEGRSLGEILRAREKIASDDAVRVAIDVAEALRAANSSGVPRLALSLDRVILTDRGQVKLCLPTFTVPGAQPLDDRYVLLAVGVLLYAMLSGGRLLAGIDEALQPGSTAAAELPPIKSVAVGTRQDVAQIVDRLVGGGNAAHYEPLRGQGGEQPFPSLDAALAALRGLLQAQEKLETRVRSTTDRVKSRRKRSRLHAVIAIVVAAAVVAGLIGLLVHGSRVVGRIHGRFAKVNADARSVVEQAERLRDHFNKAPTQQGAQRIVLTYQQAVVFYKKFIAEVPGTEEAGQATEAIRKIEESIPVFQAHAQRRIRRVAAVADLKALGASLEAEIARKKKAGGTINLTHWRVQYARLVEKYEPARDIAHMIERWMDALPRSVQRGQMEIDAEQIIRDHDTKYAPKRDYRGCINAWGAFHSKYRRFDHLRETALERHEEELNKVRRGAALAYHQLDGQAKKLIEKKDYKGARAIYQRVIKTFGFESLVKAAKTALAKLPKG
jgi:hypothetical protein